MTTTESFAANGSESAESEPPQRDVETVAVQTTPEQTEPTEPERESEIIAELQLFRRGCFRWLVDIRDRDYDDQPNVIIVEVAGQSTRVPYVANEADTYLTRCLPNRRLGSSDRIEAQFRASLSERTIEETHVFVRRAVPEGHDFLNIQPF